MSPRSNNFWHVLFQKFWYRSLIVLCLDLEKMGWYSQYALFHWRLKFTHTKLPIRKSFQVSFWTSQWQWIWHKFFSEWKRNSEINIPLHPIPYGVGEVGLTWKSLGLSTIWTYTPLLNLRNHERHAVSVPAEYRHQ